MPVQHYRELFKNIKQGKLGGLYFLFGEETFVLESALTQLIEKAVGSPPAELCYSRTDNPSARELESETAAPPFMGEYRVVTVQDSPLFSQEASSVQGVIRLLESIPEYCVLVFVLRGAPDKRKALYKALIERAYAVEFLPLDEYELTQYAVREANRAGLELDRQTAQYLSSVAQYNTQLLHHAMQKLNNYCEAGTKVLDEPVTF